MFVKLMETYKVKNPKLLVKINFDHFVVPSMKSTWNLVGPSQWASLTHFFIVI